MICFIFLLSSLQKKFQYHCDNYFTSRVCFFICFLNVSIHIKVIINNYIDFVLTYHVKYLEEYKHIALRFNINDMRNETAQINLILKYFAKLWRNKIKNLNYIKEQSGQFSISSERLYFRGSIFPYKKGCFVKYDCPLNDDIYCPIN